MFPQALQKQHSRGEYFVRQGSTNRVATDAEVMALRAAQINPKVRQLLAWQHQGKTSVTCQQNQNGIVSILEGTIVEIAETYIVVEYNNRPPFRLGIAMDDLKVSYDGQRNRPQIGFPRRAS
jgi:hypothetical protein